MKKNKMAELLISGFSLSQAAESAPCGPVDSREPCCHEPPEEDTGKATNQLGSDL